MDNNVTDNNKAVVTTNNKPVEPTNEEILNAAIKIVSDNGTNEAVIKMASRIIRANGFDVVIANVNPTRDDKPTEWVSHKECREFFATLKVGNRQLKNNEIARLLGNKSNSLISTVTSENEDGLNRHWSRQKFEAHKATLINAVKEMNRLNSLINS
jgi:hypothetical protein